MSKKRDARHFHAGKLRRTVDGVEYVEVAESGGKVFVGKNGMFVSRNRRWRPAPGPAERDGYRRIYFRGSRVAAARVVYEVFAGEIPDGMEIDHINTVRGDNRFENLRVVTHRENLLNPLTRPRRRAACARNGKKSAMSQPREQIMKNLELGKLRHRRPVVCIKDGRIVKRYAMVKDATKDTGVHGSLIIAVAKGRARSAGGFQWQYEEV